MPEVVVVHVIPVDDLDAPQILGVEDSLEAGGIRRTGNPSGGRNGSPSCRRRIRQSSSLLVMGMLEAPFTSRRLQRRTCRPLSAHSLSSVKGVRRSIRPQLVIRAFPARSFARSVPVSATRMRVTEATARLQSSSVRKPAHSATKDVQETHGMTSLRRMTGVLLSTLLKECG